MDSAVVRSLIVKLRADLAGFEASMAGATGTVQKSTSKMSGALRLLSAGVAVGLAGLGYKLAQFAVDSVRAFEDSQRVMEQTRAVIRSTGEAAGYSATQFHDLAKSLENQTTYSDEAVQSAENLLATFRKIQGPIFKQALTAVLDMSTALGQDLKTSAIQVGKALNDPTVGLTALRRVGVSFDATQVELIKHMYQMGDVAGAQRKILHELAVEFGGSATRAAHTLSGQTQQLTNRWDDFKEKVGELLVRYAPPLLDFLGQVIDKVTEASMRTRGFVLAFGPLGPAVETAADRFGILRKALDSIPLVGLMTHLPRTTDLLSSLGGAVGLVGRKVDQTRGALHHFAGMTATDFDTWRKGTIESLNSVMGSLDDLSGKAKLTASDILKAFDNQLEAMSNYRKNWETLLARGLPDSFVKQLQDMGMKGANIVAALANANEKKFDQIVRDWLKAQREATRTSNAIAGIAAAIGKIPSTKVIDIILRTHQIEGSTQIGGWIHSGLGPSVRPSVRGGSADGGRGGSAIWAPPTVASSRSGVTNVNVTVHLHGDVYDGDMFADKVQAVLTRAIGRVRPG